MDLQRLRAETPGCAHVNHLNNAGAGLMPMPVLDAVRGHLDLEAQIGGYEAADAASGAVADTYAALGDLLGTGARNVAVVENATVAMAQAVSAFDFARGDAIVTTVADYVSHQLLFLSLTRRLGVRVLRAPDLPEGGVDPDGLRALVRDVRPKFVALSWIPTNSGLVQDAAVVGAVCRDEGVPYLLDACQAVGQLPIDVEVLHCDYLAATARKFLRGPRGIGFLYVSDTALVRNDAPLYVDMRGARWTAPDRYELADGARRFENWEFPYALVLGMGAATRYALDIGVEEGGGRARKLAARLHDRLAALDGVRVLDRGRERCAIVTIEIAGHRGPDVVARLRECGINTSAVEREYAVIDMDAKGATSGVRLSPHYYNTETECDAAVDAIAELI